MDPLVSIVITTQNRANLLYRAATSALNQTYSCTEIIIVDDNSKDNTFQVVSELKIKHPKLSYIKNAKTLGACESRNIGINKSAGKFVLGLDDDDEFLPERVRSLINAYDESFAFVASWSYRKKNEDSSILKMPNVILAQSFLWRNPGTVFPLIEKSRIQAVGGFDPSLESAQDYDLWLRLVLKYGNAKVVPTPLYIIYEDAQIRISNSKNKILGRIKFIDKHRRILSHGHLKYQYFYLEKLKGKKTNPIKFFKNVPLHLWHIEYKYLLKSILGIS